jgi:NAD(P)-dependent dehydrogenase (short-subunit alcohol dehydrogenase family)
MIEKGRGGWVINLISQTGSVALMKRAAYCASKGGLNLATKVLALEWARRNILVNAVAPTFIETEFSSAFCPKTVREIIDNFAAELMKRLVDFEVQTLPGVFFG